MATPAKKAPAKKAPRSPLLARKTPPAKAPAKKAPSRREPPEPPPAAPALQLQPESRSKQATETPTTQAKDEKQAEKDAKKPPPVAKTPPRNPFPTPTVAKGDDQPEPVTPAVTPSATTQAAPPSQTAGAEPLPVPAKKLSAKEALDYHAADRGWIASEAPGDWDAVYTKANPVLGGSEHLRVRFKGSALGDVEHENLNSKVPFEGKLEDAVAVLTGEPVPTPV